MEPNNLEKLIKTTINDRSITPSTDARQRLIEALNNTPKKKNKFWIRYAIAASLVFLLCFVGGKLMFSSTDELKPSKISNQDRPIESPKLNEVSTSKKEAIVVNDVSEKSNKDNKQEKTTTANSRLIKIIDNYKKSETKVTLKTKNDSDSVFKKALSESFAKNETKQPKVFIQNDSTIINKENQFLYVTSERLLAEIENNSNINPLVVKSKVATSYIDSDKLLVDIEKQLFDQKNKSIFKKAGRQMKKIKEAVANRNYQH